MVHEARTGRLFRLNHTAARAWSLLREGGDEAAVVRDLAREHGTDPAAVRRDLEVFVSAVRDAGLLKPSRAGERQALAEARLPRGTPALDAVYRVGEVAVRVVCHPASVARALAALAAPAMAPDGSAELRLTLYRDRGGYALARDDRVVDRLPTAPVARWAVVRQLVAAGRRRSGLALLHAAAVATPRGCLLLCGDSGAGKSTLLAGLVHAGFGFVADDIVPLEEGTGLVRPVRLAISVKQGSWPTVGALFPELAGAPSVRLGGRTMRYLWPSDGFAAAGPAPRPVAAVLFPRHAKGAPASLTRLDPVRSLALLGEGGSALPASDAGLAAFLAWWHRLPAYELSYGRLDEAAREVRSLPGRLQH